MAVSTRKKVRRKARKHEVIADLSNCELTIAGSALRMRLYADGEKLNAWASEAVPGNLEFAGIARTSNIAPPGTPSGGSPPYGTIGIPS